MAQREYFEYRPDDTDYGGASDVVERETQHIRKWRRREPQLGLALSGGRMRRATRQPLRRRNLMSRASVFPTSPTRW